MFSASIDTRELEKSASAWARKFGDSNEEALLRVTAALARELAAKTQPWGVSGKTKKKLVDSVAADIRKTVRVVPDGYFNDLRSGKKRSVRLRKGWHNVRREDLMESPGAVVDHVERLRSNQTGKVDRRKMGKGQIRIVSETTFKRAAKLKSERVGLTKGLWLMAGKLAVAKGTKKKGLAVSTTRWPGKVGAKNSKLAAASLHRAVFNPSSEIENKTKMSRMERFLKSRDISKAVRSAWRKVERQYKRAVERIDREGRAR